jgi:hypothetical protein
MAVPSFARYGFMPECPIPVPKSVEGSNPDHVCRGHASLMFPVNFRPRDYIRDIERPHDLEALEHREDIVV